MADKQITELPAASGVTNDTLIPVYVPGALTPAQSMTGAQFRQFGAAAAQEQVAKAESAAERAESAKNTAVSAAETIGTAVDDANAAAVAAEASRQAIENMIVEAITLATGQSATVSKSIVDGVVKLIFGLPAGAKGDKGDAFTYADFTPEQLATLKGEKGDAFVYEDFTPEQLESLRGPAGSSIESITRTAGTGAPGTTDTYTVTLTDGRTTTFNVYNGKDGEGATTVVTIPAAWVRGDINHDGIVDKTDKALLQSGTGSSGHPYNSSNLATLFPDGNVPLDYQAADVNNNGIINSTDANNMVNSFAVRHGVSVYSNDLLQKWTLRSGIDISGTYDWLYYYDIPIADIKASDKALVTIKSPIDLSEMTVEVLNGIVRLYCIKPPHIDLTASVTICNGENEVVVVKDFLLSLLDSLKAVASLTDTAEYDATNSQEMSQFMADLRYVKFRGECSSFGGIVIEMLDRFYPARLTSYTSGDVFALQFYYFETTGVNVVAHTDTLTYDALKETWTGADGGDYTGSVTRLIVSPQLVNTDGIPVTVFGDQIASGKHHPVNGLYVRSSTEGSVKVFQISVDDIGTITATEA